MNVKPGKKVDAYNKMYRGANFFENQLKINQSPDDYPQEDYEEDNSMSDQKFQLIGMKRRQSIKPKQQEMDVISTIKNFERMPNTSIKLARDDGLLSEEEQRYDISYEIQRSDQSVASHKDTQNNSMFQEQIEFKTKRRKYQTDVRAKETSRSESSSEPIISPEKEREPDHENDFNLCPREKEDDRESKQ